MNELKELVLKYNKETKEALETIYNELNQGQRKKIVKNEAVKALFDRYNINYN